MLPTMMTQSAGRPAAASRGGGIGGRASSGGGRTKGRLGNQGDGRIDGQGGQVGGQGSDQSRGQRNGRNQNGDAVNDNIWGDVCRGCTYKEFLACNPKECRDSQKVKYTAGSFVGKTLTCNEMQKLETELWNHVIVGTGHATYTDRFHELARLVPHLVTLKGKMIERKPSKDRNVRDDNKRTRTGNAFSITTNHVRRENTGTVLECTTCSTYHPPRECEPINARNPVARACYECGSTHHIKSACPRLNQAQRLGVNHHNQVVVVNGGQGRGNQGNHARARAFMAFMLGAEDARQDSNIMTGTFTLNDHYVTTLFDSSADYSFVSTTFIPLLGIEPSDLGFNYEIEIAKA
nr:hypothetical protein [Tanacetum cinerariifolium]